jgi:hypothetical protein
MRERGRGVASAALLAAGMSGAFVASNLAYRALEPSLASRSLAAAIAKGLAPDDAIVFYGDIRLAPGIAFYCDRHVLLAGAPQSNLEFGSRYPDAPRTFLADSDLGRLWLGRSRVYLVVAADRDREALSKLPAESARVLARSGDKTVYVNQPEGR